ncbi:PH domain-containing protein [Leucobacter sp. OH2974_COT-288]|uniref:YdbS-like PH domain-containing protein n=1 Tax=Canibacter oris TaxID=1365628 RepID=A0A840DBQ6_9MICO|nr:PH domain-containing protein [Canibacter oris]MBB4070921.1 hypothetical protein [Canibacter oris]RRD36556.1 PH domain-containing protein [Leucobacter sp. OH2974_COT-288]
MEIREFDGGAQIAGLGPQQNWPYETGKWHRISPTYVWVDLATNLIFAVLFLGAAWFVFQQDFDAKTGIAISLLAIAVLSIGSGLLAFRRARTIGYMLREDDFVYSRGLLFHRVIAVPYGRLQLVDVKQGPLLRIFNLASLKFVTAAAGSNVELPGLSKEVADRLRDELIAIAESRRSGL